MVDVNSLIEGHCKFRDGKKWKTRWAVITKLSPVADCLQLQIYRDEKERARNGYTKASLSLQAFLALETGFTLDKESHTLAIICLDLCVVLAFDNRERLIQWSVRIGSNLGEGQQFLAQLATFPPKSKLTPGPVRLHVTDRKFCLTGGIPPRLLGHWEVPHLRRYGIVEGRLVFEGGSRCGKGEGVHVLVPDPPQVSLIIDALDMSSKGQLLGRSHSRRLGSSVTDSPRKSLSRLSELRSSSVSSEHTSLTPVAIPSANLAIGATTSPSPRESRSAEALCNACNDSMVSQPGSMGAGGSMWMSSEASSRCDLDSCDNISVISPEDSATNIQHNHLAGPLKQPTSPVKLPHQGKLEGSTSQISKPMPSSMERCLSCMSKLGQQGQDILSPSWTMDLNMPSATATAVTTSSSASATNANGYHRQGSIGSGNSDRLSISSHGSSSGLTEYYYDTPRSVLVGEMRRNAAIRASTPPNHQNGHGMHAGSGGSNVSRGGCSPTCRHPRNSNHTNTNGAQGQQGSSCPAGCYCPNHPPVRAMSESASSLRNSPIYYNGVAEQKASGTDRVVNLPPVTSTASHIGPYENYDFPRCTPIPFPSADTTCGCCPAGAMVEPSACSGVDWSKKPPMDRNSIASNSLGSDHTTSSEFYDTPPRHAPCACCNGKTASPNVQFCGTGRLGETHLQHNCNDHSHYQNPNSLIAHSHDPMENYDVPPIHPGGLPPAKDLQMTSGVARSVNGEGKMPLVSARSAAASCAHANAIYAQVDKTKKTPKQLPHHHHHHHFGNCDGIHQHHQPIYENHGNSHPGQQQQQLSQMQPTYANMEGPPKTHSQPLVKGPTHEPATNPDNQGQGACQKLSAGSHTTHAASNYVNLEYADSLLLYANAQDMRQEPGSDLVTNIVAKANSENDCVNEPKNQSDKILNNIPNKQENMPETKQEAKEICYENTRCKIQEVEGPKEEHASGPVTTVRKESLTASADAQVCGAAASSQDSQKDEERNLPLRRSASVPCKGGHANRGSASSSDSGVSGDGGLCFDDCSPLNDIGSSCLHESLPRKGQRSSPSASGKNASTPTPKSQDTQLAEAVPESDSVEISAIADPNLNRHYETIDESKGNCSTNIPRQDGIVSQSQESLGARQPKTNQPVKSAEIPHRHQLQQHPKNPLTLVSDANSTSSGASDMSDYIETLSSCSRGYVEAVTNTPSNNSGSLNNISPSSVSPRKTTNMKPRTGKEYFKIDRSMFKNN